MSIHLYFNYNQCHLNQAYLNYFCHLNEAVGFLISEAARRSLITLNEIVIELRRCTHRMPYVVDMTCFVTYSVEVTL